MLPMYGNNGQGLKLENIGAACLSFNAMPAKITKKYYGQSSLTKRVRTVLHNSTGEFVYR